MSMRKAAAAAVQLGSREVFRARLGGGPVAAIAWLRSLPGPVRGVYEAGPTGFGLARVARAAGQPPAALDAAWRAQLRLHRRWAHLDAARAEKRTTVAVEVARELACFVWEIARQPD
jgi:hypothetical protein